MWRQVIVITYCHFVGQSCIFQRTDGTDKCLLVKNQLCYRYVYQRCVYNQQRDLLWHNIPTSKGHRNLFGIKGFWGGTAYHSWLGKFVVTDVKQPTRHMWPIYINHTIFAFVEVTTALGIVNTSPYKSPDFYLQTFKKSHMLNDRDFGKRSSFCPKVGQCDLTSEYYWSKINILQLQVMGRINTFGWGFNYLFILKIHVF